MKISFDRLEMETTGRLAGVKSLLRLLDEAVPEFEQREQAALRELARNEDYDFGEYDVERQILDGQFKYWLPRFAAYAVITLLHMVLEVQLHACALRAQQRMNLRFRPTDIKGSGIEAAATYLTKSGAYDAKQGDAWLMLTDLGKLRHLIVHRAGTRGRIQKHRKTANHLQAKYENDLKFPDNDEDWWKGTEVSISMELCRRFTDTVEAFLGRALSAVNALPARQVV